MNSLSQPPFSVLRPKRNCWAVVRASKAAVLIDAAHYFATLEAVLLRARRSILIVGWGFDGRIMLRPDHPDGEARPLGPFLRSLVEARPELDVRILVWSLAVVHAPGAPIPLLLGAAWQDHSRIQLKLDRHHPVYAAHHQKIVCIDDQLAFVGGIDLTVRRWDTSCHLAEDPRRLDPDGTPYGPVHDMQMLVEGEAARCVARSMRTRWRLATGEEVTPPDPGSSLWPDGLDADFTDTPVAVVRTAPAWKGTSEQCEGVTLTADALRSARRCIYIETQYLTARLVGDMLVQRLQEPFGPEIVIVLKAELEGMLERRFMGENRDRLLRRLKQADRFDRLRVFYPSVPQSHERGERPVLVHAKLMIIDDRLLRVGSSNLNNRSTGLDSECDLAIEAYDTGRQVAIATIRNRLVGEHLGLSPDVVAETAAAEGSLLRAIERLNIGKRGLRGFDVMHTPGPTRPVWGTALVDPARPLAPLARPMRRVIEFLAHTQAGFVSSAIRKTTSPITNGTRK